MRIGWRGGAQSGVGCPEWRGVPAAPDTAHSPAECCGCVSVPGAAFGCVMVC